MGKFTKLNFYKKSIINYDEKTFQKKKQDKDYIELEGKIEKTTGCETKTKFKTYMYFKRYIQDNFSKLCGDDGKVHVDFEYKTYDNRILKYKGELDNIGEFTGHGIVTYPSGNNYIGSINVDYKKRGILTYKDGVIYKGNFKDNKLEGKGTIIWPDGTQYEGYFENGISKTGIIKRKSNTTAEAKEGNWNYNIDINKVRREPPKLLFKIPFTNKRIINNGGCILDLSCLSYNLENDVELETKKHIINNGGCILELSCVSEKKKNDVETTTTASSYN